MQANVTVIDSGPAGLVVALHATKSGARNVLLLEREEELGGILKQCIHNGFGLEQFKEDYTGPEYAELLIDEVEKTSICYLERVLKYSQSTPYIPQPWGTFKARGHPQNPGRKYPAPLFQWSLDYVAYRPD